MKRTSKNYLPYEEEQYYLQEYKQQKEDYYKETGHILGETKKVCVANSLLDSSLISRNKSKIYDIKLVQCGSYFQVYYYNRQKIKYDSNLEQISSKKILINDLSKTKKRVYSNELKEIEEKNIIRSKLNCQRIIKANENDFKSFITLTFSEDINSIEKANKLFQNFCRKIKMLITRTHNNSLTEFKYICVPEFQKKGRVHYHLLTNIDFNNSFLINENISMIKLKNKLKNNRYIICKNSYWKSDISYKLNEFNVCLRKVNNLYDNMKKTYNFKSRSTKYFKTLKYWNNGFSNVVSIDNINIVGYLLKYMTKDIDNRLFGKRRFFYSLNLFTPNESYLDVQNNTQDILHYLCLINNSKSTFENTYFDKLGQEIKFIEYKIN